VFRKHSWSNSSAIPHQIQIGCVCGVFLSRLFICNSGWTRHSTEGQELRSTNECDIQRENRLFPRHKGTNMRKTLIWKIPGHLSVCWRRKCGIDQDSEFAISAMGQPRATWFKTIYKLAFCRLHCRYNVYNWPKTVMIQSQLSDFDNKFRALAPGLTVNIYFRYSQICSQKYLRPLY